MAKDFIKLPSGLVLKDGEIRTPLGSGPIPMNRNTSSSYSYRRSLWSRFDDFISSIGNWFADYSENITSIFAIILLGCGGLSFIVWLFSLGLLWGIIAGIFLGGIAYYALMIVTGIFIWVGNIILGIIRYIFYSSTTFLIALGLIGLIIGVNYFSASHSYVSVPHRTDYIAPTTTKYRCTASYVLNVRVKPNTSAGVLGTIRKNEVVEVYEISNGFARIKFKGQDAYVSANFITKVY